MRNGIRSGKCTLLMDEPLEETRRQPARMSIGTDDDGWQLFMIANDRDVR